VDWRVGAVEISKPTFAEAWRHGGSRPKGDIVGVLDCIYIDRVRVPGRGFMEMLSALAGGEWLWIIKRTHEGRQLARKKGVKMGRNPKLTSHQKDEARRRLARGEATRNLAEGYGFRHSTIARLTA